jgi:cysteinyl-tRNA synthetase
VLENDDYAKLVKFGFIREGAAAPTIGANLKDTTDAGVAVAKAGDHQATTLLAETLSDDEIEKLIAERVAARRGGNYARSDEIRASLLKAGVILEDTKAGTRWKRK